MSKTAPISIDSFDPEVLAAAREVAKRAGVPLESWIESVTGPAQATGRGTPSEIAPETAPAQAEPKPRDVKSQEAKPQEAKSQEAKPQEAKSQGAKPQEAKPQEAKPQEAKSREAASSAPVDASLAAMMRRLDALDRSLNEEREASRDAAARMIGEIENRLAAKLQPAPSAPAEAAGEGLTGRLAEIERRMGEIAGQLSTPRPLGRRGKPLASEMRDAVAEVRRRQRELEEGGEGRPAALPEAPRAPEPTALPSPAIAELQQETTRLRDSLGGLATGRDVGALEQAMRALLTDMQRAREPGDFAAIAAPIELMRVQVERLAEDVAANVHARVAGEVERLAGKVDGAISGAAPSFADQSALDTVFGELDEIRRLIGALAGPERIQSLAQGVQAISAQIAQLQRGSDAEVAALKPLLEEIRSELKSPEESRMLLGRFEALADRMDRAAESAAENPAANPVGELIGRLETLGETLRQQPAGPKDFSSIQGMLETLAEKVDRVSTDGRDLDALEQHVVALAHRLDAPKAADPALDRLERTMGELVAQVSTLKDGAPATAVPDLEAAVERATRAAVKDAMAGSPPDGASTAALGLLRADLAEMRAHQRTSDQRLHVTMEGVQALLSRLSDQLDRAPTATMTSASALAAAAPARAGHAAAIAAAMELPSAETVAEKAPRERASQERPSQERPAAPKAASAKPAAPTAAPTRPRPAARPEDALDAVILGADELLEPGAGRPAPGRPAAAEPAVPAGSDIKTSFIAAARRAAQAAQAESEPPLATRLRERMGGGARAAAPPDEAADGAPSRVRGAVEKRRRTLLLGLAAVVLALGAYQAFLANGSGPLPEEAAVPSGNAVAAAPEAAKVPQAKAPETKTAEQSADAPAKLPAQAATPADPTTTQSLAEPAARALAEPAARALAEPAARADAPSRPAGPPQVASMAGLAPDLAGVPPGLAKLKQSALDGDGAAIWELAAREAEGRGVPRDLGIAAKLYERLASAGYAPAQFKLGNAYEKGSGVTRDIAQAKSWYGRAADMGNTRAMHNLAVLHAENPAASGRPDFATAAVAFRRAAEHGVRDSQYNLAVLYARGLGVSQDLVQSYLWFSTAATQGDDEAGRKRDEVAGKLAPADLARARELVAGFRPKPVDPSANEAPTPKMQAAAPPTSLIGAPSPNLPNPNSFQKRAGV